MSMPVLAFFSFSLSNFVLCIGVTLPFSLSLFLFFPLVTEGENKRMRKNQKGTKIWERQKQKYRTRKTHPKEAFFWQWEQKWRWDKWCDVQLDIEWVTQTVSNSVYVYMSKAERKWERKRKKQVYPCLCFRFPCSSYNRIDLKNCKWHSEKSEMTGTRRNAFSVFSFSPMILSLLLFLFHGLKKEGLPQDILRLEINR